MSTDILYPLLIGAGCLVLVILVHLATRPKPSRDDITIPEGGGSNGDEGAPRAGDLLTWHRTHEQSVLDFLDVVDGAGSVDDDDPEFEASRDADVANALDAAMSDHPAPEMRAELAALRSAGAAMLAAEERGDTDALDRHRAVYGQYRSAWLDRLWQFPIDERRIHEVRLRVENDTDT